MYPRKTYTLDEAQKHLERFCVYQERCHHDVQQKLIDMHMIPEARDQIIVHLLRHDFLNEERFAKAFVSGKFRIKKWGKQRLQLELKKRHIGKTIISNALAEINDEDYYNTFEELATKKLATIKDSHPQKKRKKLADYLLYRGWESSLVYDKVFALIP